MLLNKKKETRVKFNPGLSPNWLSNNWALMCTSRYSTITIHLPKSLQNDKDIQYCKFYAVIE